MSVLASLPLLLLAVPGFARLNETEALYALNTLGGGFGAAQFGRYYDAAAARPHPAPPSIAAASRPAQVHAPFKLEVPPASPSYERTFRRLLSRPETDAYDALIAVEAKRHGLDPRLVKSVIAAESEFQRAAVSPAGARGLMQVMPRTADPLGVGGRELFHPAANIRAGVAYLAHLFARIWKRFHFLKGLEYARAPQWVVQRVLAAYNAGPRFLSRRPLYRQTRHYVKRVVLFYRSRVSALRRAGPSLES